MHGHDRCKHESAIRPDLRHLIHHFEIAQKANDDCGNSDDISEIPSQNLRPNYRGQPNQQAEQKRITTGCGPVIARRQRPIT